MVMKTRRVHKKIEIDGVLTRKELLFKRVGV